MQREIARWTSKKKWADLQAIKCYIKVWVTPFSVLFMNVKLSFGVKWEYDLQISPGTDLTLRVRCSLFLRSRLVQFRKTRRDSPACHLLPLEDPPEARRCAAAANSTRKLQEMPLWSGARCPRSEGAPPRQNWIGPTPMPSEALVAEGLASTTSGKLFKLVEKILNSLTNFKQFDFYTCKSLIGFIVAMFNSSDVCYFRLYMYILP